MRQQDRPSSGVVAKKPYPVAQTILAVLSALVAYGIAQFMCQ
jgi:hypothetical protein